jgi:Flp pilus assembly pilin Flp
MENVMVWNTMKRLAIEEDGMEMVEWSIVGVVFALAAALLWGSLKDDINTALTDIGDCVTDSTSC